jgi:hypothetical protein
MKTPHIILMIGDDGALLVPFGTATAQHVFCARGDKKKQTEILSLLQRHSKVPLTLMVDTLAIDFKREALPTLNIFDRARLLQRRLQQSFPQAVLTASTPVKNDKTQILLTGLPANNPVFEWIEIIKSQLPHTTPRLTLLPIEGAEIVTRLAPDSPWALLLTRQRTGGFRQIVTHDGDIIFTRLTPPLPPSASAQDIANTVTLDVKASLGYLTRLGLTNPGEMTAIFLLPEPVHTALRGANLPITPTLLTPHQAAEKFGITTMDDVYADTLFAGWLIKKRKARLTLTVKDPQHTYIHAAVKTWGWRIAAATIVFAIVTNAWQATGVWSDWQKLHEESENLAITQQQIVMQQQAMASGATPLDRLRLAMQRQRLFTEPSTLPWDIMQKIQPFFHDGVRLVKMDWQNDETLRLTLALSATRQTDKQSITTQFQNLSQKMAETLPGMDVRLTRLPFPAMPTETLSNENAPPNNGGDGTADITIQKMRAP